MCGSRVGLDGNPELWDLRVWELRDLQPGCRNSGFVEVWDLRVRTYMGIAGYARAKPAITGRALVTTFAFLNSLLAPAQSLHRSHEQTL